ncbi:hypothetical protein ACHAW6_000433 [Cyclotella cf. meneghiniana]
MQYYTIELDEESQDLCIILIPFGKYTYLRCLTGLQRSPHIAESIMENVLSEIEDANVYIDYVGAFSKDCNHRIRLLAEILHHLNADCFAIKTLNM